jgi:hypothetical protein
MRLGALVAAVLLVAGCQPARPPQRPEPPLAVGPQPTGFKRCQAAPFDYPDPPGLPRPAPVSFRQLPLDPAFQAMGVPLVTFRSAELVFHVSPELPQVMIDCTVAAADDAVAFVTRAMALPRVIDGGPTRDVFVLDPAVSEDVLERLDPGYGFALDSEAGRAFVGHPRGRPDAFAIYQWKRLPVSYLELGAMYAHEWTHMIQDHLRGRRPSEMTAVVEGEAALFGALFMDDAVPGAASLAWEYDAGRLAEVRAKHPELTPYELLTQRAHRHHNELTLFAWLSRGVDPPALARVRLLARAERLDYETAWKRVVGRDLQGPGLDAVVAAPRLSPRPALTVSAPVLSIVRSEDRLWFVAAGFKPGERVARSTRLPEGRVEADELTADGRGVVVWGSRVGRGARYAPGEVELRGASGTCSGQYQGRVL